MNLKDLLINRIESLGAVRFSNSFGWICIYTGKNMLGGYKEIDDNVLLLFLILSPDGFNQSLDDGFMKFDFGKTWAETEINGEDDLSRTIPYFTDAFNYSKVRRDKNLKLKKK